MISKQQRTFLALRGVPVTLVSPWPSAFVRWISLGNTCGSDNPTAESQYLAWLETLVDQ